jgi:hypothetical protein
LAVPFFVFGKVLKQNRKLKKLMQLGSVGHYQ